MPKKSGPPYTDIPTDVYVVVVNPWGADRNPRSRVQRDFDNIAAWAKLVLQQAGLGGGRLTSIECIYGMGTRDEVIIQFPEGTDVIPLLGEHRWANIASHWNGPPNDPRSTLVFIYDWRNNGDPSNHNWTENFPNQIPLDKVPAKSPYPPPSWTSPPSTLYHFVLPIPRPLVLPPVPNRGQNSDRLEQQTASPSPSTVPPAPTPPEQQRQSPPDSEAHTVLQDTQSQSTSLFKPYEPPSQHPSHALLPNRQRAPRDELASSRELPPPPKIIKKLDPYELDEDALNVLRSPNVKNLDTAEEDAKPGISLPVKVLSVVKKEEDDAEHSTAPGSASQYEPSQALIDALSSLPQPEQITSLARQPMAVSGKRPNAVSRIEPPAGSGYKPSAELAEEIQNFLLSNTTAVPSSSSSGARPTRGTPASPVAAVKREYEDDASILFGGMKRIKTEEC